MSKGLMIGGFLTALFTLLFSKKESNAAVTTRVVPPSVASWTSLLEQYRGNKPLKFLQAAMQEESGGNPCAIGATPKSGKPYTPVETGIFQLYAPDDNVFASPQTLRTACPNPGILTKAPGESDAQFTKRARAAWETPLRELTDEEKIIQVKSGLALIDKCVTGARTWLSKTGSDWPDDTADFWSFVKLQHGLPILVVLILGVKGKLGRAPRSWSEYKSTVLGMADIELVAAWQKIYNTTEAKARMWLAYKGEFPRIFKNAEFAGSVVGPYL